MITSEKADNLFSEVKKWEIQEEMKREMVDETKDEFKEFRKNLSNAKKCTLLLEWEDEEQELEISVSEGVKQFIEHIIEILNIRYAEDSYHAADQALTEESFLKRDAFLCELFDLTGDNKEEDFDTDEISLYNERTFYVHFMTLESNDYSLEFKLLD